MKKATTALCFLAGPVLAGHLLSAQLPPAFTALGGAAWIGGQKCQQADKSQPCDAQYGMSYPLAIWPRPETPSSWGRIVFGGVSNLKQGGLTLGWRVADAYTPGGRLIVATIGPCWTGSYTGTAACSGLRCFRGGMFLSVAFKPAEGKP